MSTSNSWPVERVGHRHHRDRRQGSPEVRATEKVHVAIDDAPAWLTSRCSQTSRKADNRWLPRRAVGWFSGTGDHLVGRILFSDQRPLLSLGLTGEKLRALDLNPIRTKPLHPQTNGKGERFIKPSIVEWPLC